MINLLKKIKSIIMKKEELEQQLADAILVAQRLNEENKELKLKNNALMAEKESLKNDFDTAVERVRYLDGQVRMLELQNQSRLQSDNDRNY